MLYNQLLESFHFLMYFFFPPEAKIVKNQSESNQQVGILIITLNIGYHKNPKTKSSS